MSCSLLCQEAQNLLVALVEPVPVLLSGVTKHRLSSVVACMSERRPGSLKIIVCLRVGRQVASQGVLEGVLHLRFAELLHIELLLHTAGLTAVLTRQLKRCPAALQHMVGPAVAPLMARVMRMSLMSRCLVMT